MLRKIRVLVEDGKARYVWAWVVGNLGIHKTLYPEGQARHLWTITHISSGLAVGKNCQQLFRGEIPSKLKLIQSFTWRNIHVFDMPACELVDLCTTIGRELNVASVSNDWDQTVKPIVVRALGCAT